MPITSKYFLTGASGAIFLDLKLNLGDLTLDGQTISVTGSAGIDAIAVGSTGTGSVDFTASGSSADKIYLDSPLSAYVGAVAGSNVTLTLASGIGPAITFSRTTNAVAADRLVFADGTVSSLDLYNHFAQQGVPAPVPSGETSLAPQAPALPGSPMSAVVKAFSVDAAGETFAITGPGTEYHVTGGVGVERVYVGAGAKVNAANLGGASDEIYMRGTWAEYAKVIRGTTIVFTRTVDGANEEVTVAANAGALNDQLIFADGAVKSNNAKVALLANADVALPTISGFDADLVTPGLYPRIKSVFSTTEVNNLDVRSNIILKSDEAVAAVSGKHIRIVNDGGLGFRGENQKADIVIAVDDASQVSIVGGVITLNPTADLDLSNNYHIEIDAGAFVNARGQGNLALSNPTDMKFSTVTPGTNSISSAAQAVEVDSNGALVTGKLWLDIEGIGSQPSNQQIINANSGNYVFAFKDANPAGGNIGIGYDGVGPNGAGFYLKVENFNGGDLIYIDNQLGAANNVLTQTMFLTGAGDETEILFNSYNGNLGGNITLKVEGASGGFSSFDEMMAYFNAPPLVSA